MQLTIREQVKSKFTIYTWMEVVVSVKQLYPLTVDSTIFEALVEFN